jgi:hypothetical protein
MDRVRARVGIADWQSPPVAVVARPLQGPGAPFALPVVAFNNVDCFIGHGCCNGQGSSS